MKRFAAQAVWVLILAMLAASDLTAQPSPPGFDPSFAVAPAHRVLAGPAPALVRLETRRFEVEGPGAAVERVRRVVTVFAAEGRDRGRLVLAYDRFYRIKALEGRLLDADGRLIRKLGRQDVQDYSAISGFSLFEDTRMRVAELYHDVYPYTVVFEYEVRRDGLIGWPAWYPQDRGDGVEWAWFEIDAPLGTEVRYTTRGMERAPRVTRTGGRQRLRWTVQQLPAYEPEPYGPTAAEQAAAVYTAPDRFKIQGARGSMGSWAAFGAWYAGLSAGRATLPPEVVAEAQRLVADVPDDRERVRRLYRYLQARTRYVSVQLGLGGWQPEPASDVHALGYGDCKALTNYMLALLQAVGLPAYPALIRRGFHVPALLADFPSNQFNHVVLVVPLAGDTLWLENTSQTIPFGHLGADNEDRFALLIQPDGSRLVRTPRSTAADNRQTRHARVRLAAAGHAEAEVHTTYTGNQQDRVRRALARRSGQERERWLHQSLDLPGFQVVAADFSSVDAGEMSVDLPVRLRLPRYATRTGTRLFFTPNLLERHTDVPPAMAKRTQPVHYFTYAFADVDTIRYALPAGYVVEALPEAVVREAPFGRYRAEVVATPDGQLAYYRLFEITATRLPPEQYEPFRRFLADVARADRAQVVLVQP